MCVTYAGLWPITSWHPNSIRPPENGSRYALSTLMTGDNATLPGSTPAQIWIFLFHQTRIFAADHVNRRLWRGDPGGVLPDGHDAHNIAAQALADFYKDANHQPAHLPTPAEIPAILRDLQQRVRRHVDRLYHRKENFILRNEPDLARVFTDDGLPISPIELLPAPDPTGLQALLRKEDDAEVQQFRAFLGKERRLKTLFDSLCDGFRKPKALAGKLKIKIQTIKNLLIQLRRKWAQFPGSRAE